MLNKRMIDKAEHAIMRVHNIEDRRVLLTLLGSVKEFEDRTRRTALSINAKRFLFELMWDDLKAANEISLTAEDLMQIRLALSEWNDIVAKEK